MIEIEIEIEIDILQVGIDAVGSVYRFLMVKLS